MALSSDSTVMTMPVAPANTGGFGGFGGDGAWWIIILFLFVFCGWGNNGWGNNGNYGAGGVMDGYVLTSDFATVERKLDSVNNGLCDGFYAQAQLINGVQQNMSNGFMTAELSRANQQAAFMQQLFAMQMQNQQCCCDMREAIQGVNYNLATHSCATQNVIQNSTRDIIENQNSNSRAVLDFLTQSKLHDLESENQSLKLAASQAAQNNYLISQLRPTPIPSYQSCNPWVSQAPYGCCGSC